MALKSIAMALAFALSNLPVDAVRSTNQLAEDTRAAFEGGDLRRTQVKGDTAKEKLAAIWEKIMADDDEPGKMPSALAPLKLMSVAKSIPVLGYLISWTGILEDLTGTFQWHHDEPLPEEPPPKHEKLIHPVGSVAKVSLVWDTKSVEKLGYTGVFTQQQDQALLRIGPAGALKATGQAPGISLKVFRDNKESVNTVMLYSLRGQEGFSHFNHTLCNKLSDFRDKNFAEKLLLKSFYTASKYPFTTGLGEWAEGEDGKQVFPFVMCVVPRKDVRKDFEQFNTKFEHIQEQLGILNAKKIIYDIYAASEPRTQPVKIGHVQLQTKFHPTKFGDTTLFFRHDQFENDLELKPEWKSVVDDEDFWFEEGAAHFYKTIDPGATEFPGYSGANAWAGGYDPKDQWEMSKDLSELVPNLQHHPKGPDSMLETDGGVSCEGERIAYLHQGESSIVHSLLR